MGVPTHLLHLGMKAGYQKTGNDLLGNGVYSRIVGVRFGGQESCPRLMYIYLIGNWFWGVKDKGMAGYLCTVCLGVCKIPASYRKLAQWMYLVLVRRTQVEKFAGRIQNFGSFLF